VARRAAARILPERWYRRDALLVARDLIGKRLVAGPVALRITEVEAYRYPGDSANHCRFGRTPRNAPMWGPPGRAYLYLCYGMHWMLNLVTGPEGEGAAVLVRAAEPCGEDGAGLDLVVARRRWTRPIGPPLLTGPGKVAAALGLGAAHNDQPVFRAGGPLVVCEGDGPAPAALLAGPRVGIDYADPADRAAPWRIADATSDWVSVRKTLVPIGAEID
jgi:DNA-3-methyladenine glycosylase